MNFTDMIIEKALSIITQGGCPWVEGLGWGGGSGDTCSWGRLDISSLSENLFIFIPIY
jgi:hypothetical protein